MSGAMRQMISVRHWKHLCFPSRLHALPSKLINLFVGLISLRKVASVVSEILIRREKRMDAQDTSSVRKARFFLIKNALSSVNGCTQQDALIKYLFRGQVCIKSLFTYLVVPAVNWSVQHG